MKIVYFGRDVFLPSFRYLADRCEILALYTYQFPEDCFTADGIIREAESRGIPVFYGRISEDRVRRYFEEEGCDLFFSAEYGYIIPIPEDLPRFRGVNLHNALLPDGPGYFPVEDALANGLAETGVTLHKIFPEVDTGDILLSERFAIRPEMDDVDVFLKCRSAALSLTKRLMSDFDGVWSRAVPQVPTGAKFSVRPDPRCLTLTPSMTVAEAKAVWRIYNQMTRVVLGGETWLVIAMETGSVVLEEPEIWLSENRWILRLADGNLRLIVQPMEERR